jgi:hypothetical protein
MNAAPLARNSLAEDLSDEIDRAVATKEHVELIVTREVQQLRVEMQAMRSEIHRDLRETSQDLTNRMINLNEILTNRITALDQTLTNRLLTQFRWLLGWLAVVTVGIPVDLLR